MLLQETLRLLDAELERIVRIREIVAGLAKGPTLPQTEITPEIVVMEQAAPESIQEPEPSPAPKRSLLRRSFTRRKVTPKVSEPRALASSIPAGPVVMSAQALAREREFRASAHAAAVQATVVRLPEPKVAEGAAMDSLTRDLSRRWLSHGEGSRPQNGSAPLASMPA